MNFQMFFFYKMAATLSGTKYVQLLALYDCIMLPVAVNSVPEPIYSCLAGAKI